MKRFFVIAAIMVVASTRAVTAQQQTPTLKPTVSPKSPPVKTRLILEVAYNRALPPAYAIVNGTDEIPKWIWLTRFARIPGREIAPPPVQAVRLESVYNGETADVRISLLRGPQGFDREDLVGIYQVGVGEQKIVSDLDQFGIEPFTLTLLNTLPPLPPRSSSIERTAASATSSTETG